MKKIVVLLSTLLLLSSCGYIRIVNDNDIPNIVDSALNKAETIENIRRNNILTYFEYYLPSSMSEEELDSDSVVLRYNNSQVIMNLNINNVINEKYYTDKVLEDEGFFVEEYKIYEKSGQYNNQGKTKDYNYRLYKYNDLYILHLQTSDMNYYGKIELSDLNDLTYLIMIMAKSTIIKTDDIIKDFSNFDVIDYTKKQIDLFDITMPSSGELSNLLVEGATVGNADISKDGQIDDSNTNNGAPIE